MFSITWTVPIVFYDNCLLIVLKMCVQFMEVDQNSGSRGDGFKSYYTTKIEELLLVVAEKSMNLRRLQAQRNELNAKGI